MQEFDENENQLKKILLNSNLRTAHCHSLTEMFFSANKNHTRILDEFKKIENDGKIDKSTYKHCRNFQEIQRKSKSEEILIKLREFSYDPEMLLKYH